MANKKSVRASTQDHLDVDEITEDLVILKNGWVAMVLATTAVNFDLLSEAEQDATIYAYGALLNSLSFPLQILIRSKKADITAYFNSLEEAERIQPNPDLRRQIGRYKEFIQSTVQQKTVLDKKFYLVVTFSPLELGLHLIGGKKKGVGAASQQLVVEAKIALAPKRDHVIAQTARLGLSTRQLVTQELVELFYDIYNPAPIGTQRVLLDTASYTTPMVKPAVEVPVPAPTEQLTVDSSQKEQKQNRAATVSSEPETDNYSSVNRQPITELRPVPAPTPGGAGPAPGQAKSPVRVQTALGNLQEVNRRAAELLKR